MSSCGKTIRSTSKGSFAYGSPIQACPRCNKIYIDKYFKEPAIEPEYRKRIHRINWGFLILTILGLIFSIFGFSNWKSDEVSRIIAISFLVISILFLMGFLLEFFSYENKLTEQNKLIKESEERMKNVEYARTLSKLGYNVPEKYLNKSKW